MNEDLEAKLNEITFCHGCKYEYAPREECPCNLIAKELKRKENLVAMCDRLAKSLGLKEQDYLELETLIAKKDKALEILRTFAKSINLKYFFCNDLVIVIIGGDDFEWQYKCETQEEYDLLNEVLTNEKES